MELGEQVQREAARRKAADDRLAAEANTVHQIPHAESIRTEERQEGQKRRGREGEEDSQEPREESGDSAGTAESHLDFLA